MSIAPDPRGPDAVPLTIVAQLDPAPDWEELPWWREQLQDLGNILWTGSSTGVTTIQASTLKATKIRVEAAEDQLEAVARQLLAAVDEANAVYPERYATWRRVHDAQVAEERRRQERRAADRQAILDRVMKEHRPRRPSTALAARVAAVRIGSGWTVGSDWSSSDSTARG